MGEIPNLHLVKAFLTNPLMAFLSKFEICALKKIVCFIDTQKYVTDVCLHAAVTLAPDVLKVRFYCKRFFFHQSKASCKADSSRQSGIDSSF